MAVPLILGSILFTDFEIPSQIPFGGAQSLVVKKLVGGQRVVDAMGRDDMNIGWSGRFRGQIGEARARLLDQMRIDGQEQILTWSTLRYRVVVERFEANFQQPFEIPYSISCLVIEDLSAPILIVAPDPDALIDADITAAVGTPVTSVPVTAAVGAVASSAALITSFRGVSVADVNGVQASIQGAQGAVAVEAGAQNGIVNTAGVAGVVAGVGPAQLAATLSQQAASFMQLGNLYQLQALLGRTSINITNAGN